MLVKRTKKNQLRHVDGGIIFPTMDFTLWQRIIFYGERYTGGPKSPNIPPDKRISYAGYYLTHISVQKRGENTVSHKNQISKAESA